MHVDGFFAYDFRRAESEVLSPFPEHSGSKVEGFEFFHPVAGIGYAVLGIIVKGRVKARAGATVFFIIIHFNKLKGSEKSAKEKEGNLTRNSYYRSYNLTPRTQDPAPRT